jgi:DNA polymerase (family 10)
VDNRQIGRVLHEIADLLDIKGDDTFRIRSYRLAAESIESCGLDIGETLRRGEPLPRLPGVGKGIEGKVRELLATGACVFHQELLGEVPAGLLQLLRIPGLGPRGIHLVWSRLGVRGPTDLQAAIADGRFRTLPGMKEKKEARIRKGLEEALRTALRFLLPEADATVDRLSRHLRERGAERVEAVGSYRRRRETVGDLDLLVLGDAAALSEAFVTHPEVKEVLVRGAAKSSVVLSTGLQVDLRPFAPESLGAALQYFTGSRAHNVAVRERAVRRGLKLNEYGVFQVEQDAKIAGATEEDVYAALGLRFVPPELREDRGEIAAAEKDALPALVRIEDVRGDLHAHTTESDGRDTLEAMVEAARARGLEYLAVTEHSRAIPSPKRGTGMDETRCLEHIARVRSHQERVAGIRLLAGIEVDILPDGRLDMDDEVLAQLDVVVASLHSRLDMDRGQMTERVLRAFENRHFQIWGHPLSRLLLKRDAVALDVDGVIAEAARRGIALEINCQPDRLDLPDPYLRPARAAGARFVISTDSHSVHAFANLRYGVGQARRGWLTPGDVLNTRGAANLLDGLRRRAS